METTILHQAGFTVVLESNGTVSLRENGKLPTLDDIARQKARNVYFVADEPTPDDTYDEVG